MYHHCLLETEVGLSALESGLDPHLSGAHICIYFNPAVCLLLSSLHAGLLSVLTPTPIPCLSFPAWCSLIPGPAAEGVWFGCDLWVGVALPDPSLHPGSGGALCVWVT